MNKLHLYIFLFIGFTIVSCVPTQDLIYLQNKDDNSKQVVNQVSSKPYRLQVNDVLSVSIKSLDSKLVEIFSNSSQAQQGGSMESLYFTGYTVDDHGNIRIPILGELNVLGNTADEVRKAIENKLLSDYFKKEAEIFVTVKLAGFRYTINGEVGNTGTKILYQDKVNILEAVANSGDITVTGDRKNVKVIRQFSQGAETFSIDLTNANAVNSPCYYLQPNDYIYVKPLKQKTWGTGKTGIESLASIIAILSLATTTFLLFKN
jgi:polysaccharide export outer membrane protein